MRFLNAAALLCLLVNALVDVAYVLPRMDTMAHGKLIQYLVFDLGSFVVIGFSGWCMFLRGRAGTVAQIQMLVSLALQMLALTAISQLGPWVPVSELGDPSDPGPSRTFVYARVIFALLLMLLMLHWSWRVSRRAPMPEQHAQPEALAQPALEPAPKAKSWDGKERRQRKRESPVFGPDDYYEPPAHLMGGETRPGSAPPPPPRIESLHEELVAATPTTRHATAALLRLRRGKATTTKKGKVKPPKYDADIVGSATCIVANKYLVTAFKVLNGGEPREPDDKYYAMISPDGGTQLFHFPVIGFAFEDAQRDLAVLEIGPCVNGNKRMLALPLAMREVPDGTSVLAVGYPASPVFELEVDEQGGYVNGSSVLKSHVNTGIVAACFPDLHGNATFEFNFSWLPGEMGGPVVRLGVPRALFAVMKDYRPIRTPDGSVIPGPYQGISLKPIEAELRKLGAAFV